MLLLRLLSRLHTFLLLCFVARFIAAAPRFLSIKFNASLLATKPQDFYAKRLSPDLEHRNIVTDFHIEEVESLLISPPLLNIPTPTSTSFDSLKYQYPFSFSFITENSVTEGSTELFTNSITPTMTVTVTQEEPITITISEAPIIETQTIIVTVFPDSSTSISSTASSSTSTQSSSPPVNTGNEPSKVTWAAPADMTDLSSFRVSKFVDGKSNLKIVSSISSEASKFSEEDDLPQGSSAMQLFYPANSIDPANKPQGGAQFYASPIDTTDAMNVTLTYSVFFPKNFNWVLAGKLPGLYGGHTGCSGGNAALDCFSTRLMWRQGGAGELYLYAPKDKQTKALCLDPQSVCDADYGLSVGRGSFHWETGSWTTVKQTVSLNTPGMQDGEFALDVNGKRAIYRNDVLYRKELNTAGAKKTKETGKTSRTTKTKTKTNTSTEQPAKPTTTTATSSIDDGDILGPLLSGILGGLRKRDFILGAKQTNRDPGVLSTTVAVTNQLLTLVQPQPTASNPVPAITSSAPMTSTIADDSDDDDDAFGIESTKETEVKFAGIFFSTFFGGHEAEYATPEDQYAWFKNFALEVNS